MSLLPWSPLRNVLKLLKSSLSPGQIALGFALGAFAGLPPAGLHLLLPLSAALLLRLSFKAFLLSWGLFELLSIPLAPAGHAIGQALLIVPFFSGRIATSAAPCQPGLTAGR